MGKNNVLELERRVIGSVPLTELLKGGDRKQLAQAVESEVQDLLAKHQDCRTTSGHAGVVRNGYLPERELQTGLGPIRVKIPKFRSRTGEFSVSAGDALYSQDAIPGSGRTLAVFERCFHR